MSDTIQTKRCSHCKQTKPLSEFSKYYRSKDRFQSYCIICNRIYNKTYQQTEKGQANLHKRTKKYQKTPKGKATRKRFKTLHPNHIKAVDAVNHAIEAGKLARANTKLCHYCPKPAQQCHHWHGYEPEYWLDVVPVCTDCHRKIHSKSSVVLFDRASV